MPTGKNGGAGAASSALSQSWVGLGSNPGGGGSGHSGDAPPPGGGDGVGGGGDHYARRDWVEARMETLRSSHSADMQEIRDKLSLLPTFRQLTWTVGGIAVATILSIITILGLMQDRFESGISNGAAFGQDLERQRQTLDDIQRGLADIRREVEPPTDEQSKQRR